MRHHIVALRLGVILVVLLALPAIAAPKCNKARPCPIINFNPPFPTVDASDPAGTVMAYIIVTMTDGSSFSGNLGFGPPYSSDAGFCVIQGTALLLGASPTDSSLQRCTITATTQ